METSDHIACIILTIFYLIQGLVLGIVIGALPVLLVEKGYSLADIGFITLGLLPFSLKIFFASILDYYYLGDFGKRKTYIIPCKYLIGVGFYMLSYYIDQIIISKHIYTLSILILSLVFMASIADIALDGWALTLFTKGNIGLGSTCQSVGQNTGIFISQFVFIKLNSVQFCNQYIFSVPHTEPLITLAGYFKWFGVFVFIYTFIIHIAKKEKNPDTYEFKSILEVYTTLKGFWLNKQLKKLALFAIFFRIGFSPIDAGANLKLIKMGFPKDTYANIGIGLFPVQVIVPIIMAKYITKNVEMKVIFAILIFKILDTISILITIHLYEGPGNGSLPLLILIIINNFGVIVANSALMTCFYAFTIKIADPAIGGTFITAFTSILNISKTLVEPVSLGLSNFIPFKLLAILGIIYEGLFVAWNSETLLEFQDIPKHQWSLLNLENDDRQIALLDISDHD